jgi:hypothetical protein
MTKQMLMYRAASFWTNAYAPELSMGMKTDDEIRDIVDVEFEEIKDDVLDKVATEIAEKANAGTSMSFDNPPAGPASEENPPAAAPKNNENPPTPPPAGPQQSRNSQTTMPGF